MKGAAEPTRTAVVVGGAANETIKCIVVVGALNVGNGRRVSRGKCASTPKGARNGANKGSLWGSVGQKECM